jgi:hypothetical protein
MIGSGECVAEFQKALSGACTMLSWMGISPEERHTRGSQTLPDQLDLGVDG